MKKYFTRTVETEVDVDVDIDIDEIIEDLDDKHLIEELESRGYEVKESENVSLEYEMKLELVQKIADKYSLLKLEELFKNII